MIHAPVDPEVWTRNAGSSSRRVEFSELMEGAGTENRWVSMSQNIVIGTLDDVCPTNARAPSSAKRWLAFADSSRWSIPEKLFLGEIGSTYSIGRKSK